MRFRKNLLISLTFIIGLGIYLLLGVLVILPVSQMTGIANVRLFCMYPEGDGLRPAFCDELTAPDCGYLAAYGANFVHEYLETLQQLKNDDREYNQAQAAKQPNRMREIGQRKIEHQQWLVTSYALYRILILSAAKQFTQEECLQAVVDLKHGRSVKDLSQWIPYVDRFMTLLSHYRRTGKVEPGDLDKG